MKTVFVSHPYSSAPGDNSKAVRRLSRVLACAGHLPFAPQIYLPQSIDEATERDLAVRLCHRLIGLSDEMRVFGSISEGMRLEIAEARRLGIPVVAGDKQGAMALTEEPPRR